MYVVKRNGQKQPVQFDKITARLMKLVYGLNSEFVDPIAVSQKVTGGTRRLSVCMIAMRCCSAAPGARILACSTARPLAHAAQPLAPRLAQCKRIVSDEQLRLSECRSVQGSDDVGAG